MTNDLEPRANAQNAAFALRAVAPFACYHVHLIVTDEQHPPPAQSEFLRYSNQDRPHRALGSQTPDLRARPETGTDRSRPVLHCVHQVYE